jgi:hypothetical protein
MARQVPTQPTANGGPASPGQPAVYGPFSASEPKNSSVRGQLQPGSASQAHAGQGLWLRLKSCACCRHLAWHGSARTPGRCLPAFPAAGAGSAGCCSHGHRRRQQHGRPGALGHQARRRHCSQRHQRLTHPKQQGRCRLRSRQPAANAGASAACGPAPGAARAAAGAASGRVPFCGHQQCCRRPCIIITSSGGTGSAGCRCACCTAHFCGGHWVV